MVPGLSRPRQYYENAPLPPRQLIIIATSLTYVASQCTVTPLDHYVEATAGYRS
jgi:hypothetical protein